MPTSELLYMLVLVPYTKQVGSTVVPRTDCPGEEGDQTAPGRLYYIGSKSRNKYILVHFKKLQKLKYLR